jgi:methionyl-tRNA formyltransferase
MRIILFGASDLTIAVADKLIEIGFQPVGVITVPQKFNISYSSTGVVNYRSKDIASWAKNLSIPHHIYEKISEAVKFSQDLSADLAVVAGWYHIVDARLRSCFNKGCIGLHASLLPRYRGGAPLNYAILNGDVETGVSMFSLNGQVDTGEIYGQVPFPISANDYIEDLVRKSHDAAIKLIGDSIPLIAKSLLASTPQIGMPTYSLQRTPEDGLIDWRNSAEKITRLVRATSRPYPGAFSLIEGKRIIIWKAKFIENGPKVYGSLGQIAVLKEYSHPVVITGHGLLLLEEIEEVEAHGKESARLHQQRFDIF